MATPVITLAFAALAAVWIYYLQIRVILLRRRHRVGFGHGRRALLHLRVAGHAHSSCARQSRGRARSHVPRAAPCEGARSERVAQPVAAESADDKGQTNRKEWSVEEDRLITEGVAESMAEFGGARWCEIVKAPALVDFRVAANLSHAAAKALGAGVDLDLQCETPRCTLVAGG